MLTIDQHRERQETPKKCKEILFKIPNNKVAKALPSDRQPDHSQKAIIILHHILVKFIVLLAF